MPKVYVFDIDETIEISAGPVTLAMMQEVKDRGHIVGLCGNWAVFCQRVPDWYNRISFMNTAAINKESHLAQLKMYIPCDEVVFVGNIFGVSGGSDDKGAAERATQVGYPIRFIKESDFANGTR